MWPDNEDASNVFVSMCTQWRAGFGGVFGLDYAVLPALMDLLGIAADRRADVFNDIRTMEDAALAHIRRK